MKDWIFTAAVAVLAILAAVGWGRWYFSQETVDELVAQNNRLARQDSVKTDSIGKLKGVARRRAALATTFEAARNMWRKTAGDRADRLAAKEEELAAAGDLIATLRDSLEGTADQVVSDSGVTVAFQDSSVHEHGRMDLGGKVHVPSDTTRRADWSVWWNMVVEPVWSITWTEGPAGDLVPECRFDLGWPNAQVEDLNCVQNVEPPPIQDRARPSFSAQLFDTGTLSVLGVAAVVVLAAGAL